jgi:hypothetical protein
MNFLNPDAHSSLQQSDAAIYSRTMKPFAPRGHYAFIADCIHR